jgi:hypothetical protein
MGLDPLDFEAAADQISDQIANRIADLTAGPVSNLRTKKAG